MGLWGRVAGASVAGGAFAGVGGAPGRRGRGLVGEPWAGLRGRVRVGECGAALGVSGSRVLRGWAGASGGRAVLGGVCGRAVGSPGDAVALFGRAGVPKVVVPYAAL